MQTCPVCDRPIHDQAYVCSTCGDLLAEDLRTCASLWLESELTLTRQAHVSGGIGVSAREHHTVYGPYCQSCEHPSCEVAVHSQMRARMAGEQPIPNEEAMPMHYGASEARWIAANTITTWARHVSEERGIPIPDPPRPVPPATVTVTACPRKEETLCPMSDLPPEQCACRRHRETA